MSSPPPQEFGRQEEEKEEMGQEEKAQEDTGMTDLLRVIPPLLLARPLRESGDSWMCIRLVNRRLWTSRACQRTRCWRRPSRSRLPSR